MYQVATLVQWKVPVVCSNCIRVRSSLQASPILGFFFYIHNILVQYKYKNGHICIKELRWRSGLCVTSPIACEFVGSILTTRQPNFEIFVFFTFTISQYSIYIKMGMHVLKIYVGVVVYVLPPPSRAGSWVRSSLPSTSKYV